jgi:hypothetical protein
MMQSFAKKIPPGRYTVQSAAPDENLTGIFICRHKPDPAFLNKFFPNGCEARKNKVFSV